ncbi:MAG: hypothetical protein MUF87_02430 [Anaerolineae bacterium]|nr:hypothetical protein [Anaerolineae bacterium]
MLRSTAQDDLIPMPTSESTADPVLTPEILVPLLTPSDGAVFSEDEDFQFDWLPIPEAHHYQLKLERDGVFYGQIDFSSGSICSPTICEVYPPLFNLPPLEAGHTYAWSITAQTPQGNIASLKPTFTITYFVAGFEVATDEWSDPATANPTWILYADSFGLSILDPNLPNTDPFFDRRILVSNGSNIAGNFGLITHPVWKPDTRTLAFVGATSYRNGIGELVFYPRDIWTMRASGQQLQQLTFTSETEQQLAWSPDGVSPLFGKSK